MAAANKTGFWKEFESWKTPEAKEVTPAPKVGTKAPSSDKLLLPDGRLTLVVFLRHCGCPCELLKYLTLIITS